MKEKLTLTFHRDTIQKAKIYVSKTSGSLSGLIEDFLEKLVGKNTKYSAVDASRGLLKGKLGSLSDNVIRRDYHRQNHGV